MLQKLYTKSPCIKIQILNIKTNHILQYIQIKTKGVKQLQWNELLQI